MSRYFLDESGHGGDLVSSSALDFSGQPIFALAAIGIADEDALVTELDRLRLHYRCGEGELKSSSLGAKLPAVAFDLAQWLIAHGGVHFIELVEKRHFLVIHLVTRVLCGGHGLREVDQGSRNAVAEFLSDPDFDEILLAYLGACRSQSLEDIASLLDRLWIKLDESDDDIARVAQVLTMFARDKSRRAEATASEFLPLADESDTGKPVWMLPNLQCLTNIYARINQSRRGLAGVTLVHDAQLQYSKVLADAKAMMEALATQEALPLMPFSDYQLRGQADLAFAAVANEPCLQAADILAGCAMRFARYTTPKKGKNDAALRHAFLALLDAGHPFAATGINLVMSDRLLSRLGVPYVTAAPFVEPGPAFG